MPAMLVRDHVALGRYLGLMALSERALAKQAGLSPATVNHLVSGRRSSCSVATAKAIEAVLGCPAGVFFEQVSGGARPAAVRAG